MKACSLCGAEKPLSDFQKDSRKRLGVRSRCGECVAPDARERSARWHAENRDGANARRRAARDDRERAADRVRDRARRQTPEWREYQRQWRANNPDAIRKHMSDCQGKYPRWTRSSTDPDTREYIDVLIADPCGFCGVQGSMEIDHIEPRSADGSDHWSNLSALCRSCNASKNARPLLVALIER